MDNPPEMKVVPLNLTTKIKGHEILLHPTLVEINDKNFLIDCGYEESFEGLVEQLSENNVPLSELFGILVSHDDIDHIGSLYKFKAANPGIIVFASKIEEPSLTGKVKSERLEQTEQSLSVLPEAQKAWALDFRNSLKSIKRIPVDRTLEDGDILENEIMVIHTPGHTKGHVCFYLRTRKVLVANDALVFENNTFNIANPQLALDLDEAVNSIRKLTSLDIERIICYHGGEVTGNIRKMLNELILKFEKSKG